MRIIKVPTLRGYARRHPAARGPLERWIQVVRAADWSSLDDTRATFAHADEVKVHSGHTVTVFNVAGNRFRLIVSIKYRWGVVYVRDFLTHADYSRDTWKTRH